MIQTRRHKIKQTYLKHRSGAENHLLDSRSPDCSLTERRQVMQQQVCALRLTGARLARDNDALVHVIGEHLVVRGVGDREYVRRQLAQPSILVQLHVLWVVDRVEPERVDGDQYRADVRVDVALLEAPLQVIQERVLIEIRKVAQIRVLLILGLHQERTEEVLDWAGSVRVGPLRTLAVRIFHPQVEPVFRRVDVEQRRVHPRPQQLDPDGVLAALQVALLADLAGRTEALREFVVRRVADLKLLDGRLDDVVGPRHLERFDTDELHDPA